MRYNAKNFVWEKWAPIAICSSVYLSEAVSSMGKDGASRNFSFSIGFLGLKPNPFMKPKLD